MKAGRSLSDLAKEIERQKESKHDFVAPTAALSIVPAQTGPAIQIGDKGTYKVNDIAHDQIAEHVKIPKTYYDRLRKDAPALLADNVNHWFKANPTPRLVRTLDGNARAFLSNGFRPLDNFDFANVILDATHERKLEIVSCEITERRLYIKAIDTKEFKVPVGYKMGDGSHKIFDTCVPAFIASNSEVGFGRLILETGVYTRACTNLAWFSDGGMKRTHIGARLKVSDSAENIDHLLTDRTKQKTDEALWLQLRDVLAASFDEKRLTVRAERLAATAEAQITGKVEKVIEVVAERYSLNTTEKESVLQHLIKGGSLTQYGLHAAITRSAQDADSYDRATELEYAGGQIIELPKTDWSTLAAAA